jgi:endogenous inhibitor of DNA gyrase (YacG/DUF329 family)
MTTTEKKTVPCPQCKKPVIWTTENAFRPFCSERCKLIDLGDWASEKHAIPGEVAEQQEPKETDVE